MTLVHGYNQRSYVYPLTTKNGQLAQQSARKLITSESHFQCNQLGMRSFIDCISWNSFIAVIMMDLIHYNVVRGRIRVDYWVNNYWHKINYTT